VNVFKQILIVACATLLAAAPLLAQEGEEKKQAAETPKKASITIGGNTLSLEQAIDHVLRNNLTLQREKYSIIMSDTGYNQFNKKFATTLNADAGYMYQKSPDTGMSIFTGTKAYQWDAGVSVSKWFSSGTQIAAGVRETFFDANDQALAMGPVTLKPEDPGYHKPSFYVSLQQELLKNSFGMNDRAQLKLLDNATQMQRQAIVDMLSGLVVSTLVDYWTVTIKKTALDNAKLELDAYRQIRNIIAGNVRYGLAEAYDLNQYNAVVAGTETKLELVSRDYREAVRKLLRTMNMPPETEVMGVTQLIDDLPVLELDPSLDAAFKKRVDYKNALLRLENAKHELLISETNALPSLTLNVNLSTLGQSDAFGEAAKDTAAGTYPTWQVRAKMSYPLDDSEIQTSLRNAHMKKKQAEIDIQNYKQEIRDDVINKFEAVKVQHTVLGKAREARASSELWYQQYLAKFRQGKVSAINMRMAVSGLAGSRQGELEALVYYNVSLLQFEMAKNEIFEHYNVNVEKYIRELINEKK
jgi:outer membrane protein TolC